MANFKIVSITLGLLFVFFSVCTKDKNSNEHLHANQAADKLTTCTIIVSNSLNQSIKATVEVADNDASRQKGLMFRKSLPQNHGMLFVFEYEEKLNFWMKNTYIPLDIAYISNNGTILETHYMKPLDISITYPSKKPALYALEMAAGWFKKNHISSGNRVNVHGCLGK